MAGRRSAPERCKRDLYKQILENLVDQAELPTTLPAAQEFAPEIVEKMNLVQAGRSSQSLNAFVSDVRAALRAAARERPARRS